MKLKKSGEALTRTAYIISIFYIIAAIIPLLILLIYSLKDSYAIYEYPPNLIPSIPKSVSIVLDYSEYDGEDENILLDMMLKDSAAAMYATIYELDKDSIGEVRVFGSINGKNVFYQRAHAMYMRLQLDYGYMKGLLAVNRYTLTYNERYKKVSEEIGYSYDISGINENYNVKEIGNSELNEKIIGYLTDESKDRGMNGKIEGTIIRKNATLWLKSFYYYIVTPSYMYNTVPSIAKYSFLAFLFNTVLVVVWAVIVQISLCTLTAFALSRLFKKKIADMIIFYFLVTMMIPFICILVPQMILLKSIGAMNNYAAMLLPWLYPAPFFIYLFKVFFDRLPQSLFDAAMIDGASAWYSYTKICLPLSKPIIAVLTLSTIMNAWGDFFWYLMAANRTHLWTINLALYSISSDPTTKQNISMGLAFVTIMPVILLALIFSKQIKESIASSGIKG